ncbi:hypothetical protein [Streptomyces mayteni]
MTGADRIPAHPQEQLRPRLAPYLSTECEVADGCLTAGEGACAVVILHAYRLHRGCSGTCPYTGRPCTCPCHGP